MVVQVVVVTVYYYWLLWTSSGYGDTGGELVVSWYCLTVVLRYLWLVAYDASRPTIKLGI